MKSVLLQPEGFAYVESGAAEHDRVKHGGWHTYLLKSALYDGGFCFVDVLLTLGVLRLPNFAVGS